MIHTISTSYELGVGLADYRSVTFLWHSLTDIGPLHLMLVVGILTTVAALLMPERAFARAAAPESAPIVHEGLPSQDTYEFLAAKARDDDPDDDDSVDLNFEEVEELLEKLQASRVVALEHFGHLPQSERSRNIHRISTAHKAPNVEHVEELSLGDLEEVATGHWHDDKASKPGAFDGMATVLDSIEHIDEAIEPAPEDFVDNFRQTVSVPPADLLAYEARELSRLPE